MCDGDTIRLLNWISIFSCILKWQDNHPRLIAQNRHCNIVLKIQYCHLQTLGLKLCYPKPTIICNKGHYKTDQFMNNNWILSKSTLFFGRSLLGIVTQLQCTYSCTIIACMWHDLLIMGCRIADRTFCIWPKFLPMMLHFI